ncbi:hypothetical protein ABT391_36790 [Streptomyces jumonjinensis]|uniref:hypothetical protein n=1 Tax=Streptomyces jumonjinensis TaxID=1945 RepID=UPI003326C056
MDVELLDLMQCGACDARWLKRKSPGSWARCPNCINEDGQTVLVSDLPLTVEN